MTECAMYNMTLSEGHPSTICVEMSRFNDSLNFLFEMLGSEYVTEYMDDFIRDFARTDEIMPEDKTLGFVVVNMNKKRMTLAFNRISDELKQFIREKITAFRSLGYDVELDIE